MGANDTTGITEQVDSRLNDLFGSDDEPDSSASPPASSAEAAEESPGAEVEQRLDRFFEEEEDVPEKTNRKPARETAKMETSPINDLKSVILSLEWEITDQVMQKLGEEIRKLEGAYRSDKIAVAFLQLLGSLGKYIRKKRAEAHPESIRLLNSVYENLEMVLTSKELGEAEKKKMLVSQVNQYKKLKEEIKTPGVGRRVPEGAGPSESSTPATDASEPRMLDADPGMMRLPGNGGAIDDAAGARHQEMIQAIRSLQKTVQEELRALRQDIQRISGNR
ncbi:MAG: hypothetical protein ACLFPR_02555 [Desulfococcaceae bacterium]